MDAGRVTLRNAELARLLRLAEPGAELGQPRAGEWEADQPRFSAGWAILYYCRKAKEAEERRDFGAALAHMGSVATHISQYADNLRDLNQLDPPGIWFRVDLTLCKLFNYQLAWSRRPKFEPRAITPWRWPFRPPFPFQEARAPAPAPTPAPMPTRVVPSALPARMVPRPARPALPFMPSLAPTTAAPGGAAWTGLPPT